jgi:hypothetical protein
VGSVTSDRSLARPPAEVSMQSITSTASEVVIRSTHQTTDITKSATKCLGR